MDKDHKLDVRVGLFVVGTVLLAVLAVMLLGKSRHVFEQRARLQATFADVAGLVQGAPVRIAGVNVGTVSQIMFVRAARRPLIQVNMEITQSSLGLVRADSVARISSQGLLGDKIVEISAGSTDAAAVLAGGQIRTAESPDMDKMMQQAGAVLDDARRVADRAAAAVDQFADAKTIGAMRESMLHIHGLLHQADKGRGLAHSLFYDERTGDEIDRLLASLNHLAAHVDHGVQRIDSVLDATDSDGREVINNVSRAAKKVDAVADRITASRVIPNLEHATGDLADMTTYMKKGQGTIGALIMDPTIYDQLVQVLGGIGRSRILRALVRYAISRDDERAVGKRVVDERNVPAINPPK